MAWCAVASLARRDFSLTISSRKGISSMVFVPPRIFNNSKLLYRNQASTWVTASRFAFSAAGLLPRSPPGSIPSYSGVMAK